MRGLVIAVAALGGAALFYPPELPMIWWRFLMGFVLFHCIARMALDFIDVVRGIGP